MSLIPLRFKDYPHDLCKLHTEKIIGNFELRKKQIPMGTELQFYTKDLGMCRSVFKTPYKIIQLLEVEKDKPIPDENFLEHSDGNVWMSDTPMEYETNIDAIRKATGDVLECGLGIGMFTYYASRKKEVKSITVVELEKDVIDLVYPSVKNKKTSIINSDAIEFLMSTEKKFDMIHIDIWADITPYKSFEPILKLAKTKLKPNGIASCWLDDNWKKIINNIKSGARKQTGFGLDMPPCIGCGKTMRYDYAGFCMDCADSLGLSEIFLKEKVR